MFGGERAGYKTNYKNCVKIRLKKGGNKPFDDKILT